MTEEEKKEKFLEAAPKPTAEELDKMNGLFQAYIFRRAKTKEVWTTCCRKHKSIEPGMHAEEDMLLWERHTPEPIYRQFYSDPINKFEADRRVRCPWCGKEAKLKELGSCGNRMNLSSYRRAVVLRQYRGKLWAIAYDLCKSYTSTERLETRGLTSLPEVNRIGVYRFQPGKAEMIHSSIYYPDAFGSVITVDAPGEKRSWMLSAPFPFSQEYGLGYDLIGMEEIKKSEFRYCRVPELIGSGCDPLRLLTLCCFYPRQVEFLEKIGLTDAVKDYTERGIKSYGAVQWDAQRPQDFLGMSVKEAQQIVALRGGVEAVRTYRALRETKGASIEESIAFEKAFSRKDAKTIRAKAKRYGVTIGKMMRYLEAKRDQRGGNTTLYDIGEEYRDYLNAAEGVGLDLHNHVFLMPKDLRRKHDEVTAAYSQLLAERRSAEEEAAYKPRRDALEKRYAFSYGGMCIVIPSCANAIVQEGKTLHHCVGGYADRHIKGATTILFLRREEDPKKPLVTIEMAGNRIEQIHGWDDERTACKENPKRISCRVLYKAFLEVWKEWLDAGSKRNKDGTPKLPRKLKEVKTA